MPFAEWQAVGADGSPDSMAAVLVSW